MIPVNVSAAMLRQSFHACEVGYIQSTCRGRCCEHANGIMVTIHETEAEKFRARGVEIEGGFIKADNRGLCPFKTNDGLCSTHEDKPFGCAASPFTLNANDTLIVRNRYRLLKCYKCPGSRPAYLSHHGSLVRIFGDAEADRITEHLDSGGGDIVAHIPETHYAMLKENDAAKKAVLTT